MSSGYRVDPSLLQQASKGINDTISELKTLGCDGEAEEGNGFDDVEMDSADVGCDALTDAISEFTDRWSWAVRSLVHNSTEIAQRLGLNAGMYHDMEQYGVGVLKDAVNAVAGDPHASSDQVEKESLSQIIDQDRPDYSAASWDKTGKDAKATWSGEARDLAEGPLGMGKGIADATGHGQQFSQGEDQVFGPAPTTSGSGGS